MSRMNPGSKRLRLSPSKTCISDAAGPSNCTAGPPSSSPPHFSYDALPLPLAAGSPAGSRVEEEGYLVVEEDATDSSLIITMGRARFPRLSQHSQLVGVTAHCVLSVPEDSQLEGKAGRRRAARSRKRKLAEEERGASESEGEVEIDRQLDQSLETKSRQHNLTTVNVKNIIHVSAFPR